MTYVNPLVSIATPVVCIDSSMYQFMKLLFPAEWFPMISTETFFLGFQQVNPSKSGSLAISRIPTDPGWFPFGPRSYKSWMAFKIRSFGEDFS